MISTAWLHLMLGVPVILFAIGLAAYCELEARRNADTTRHALWRGSSIFWLLTTLMYVGLLYYSTTGQFLNYVVATQIVGVLSCPICVLCYRFAKRSFGALDARQRLIESRDMELRESHDELTARVEDRTRDLHSQIGARQIAERRMQRQLLALDIEMQAAASLQEALRPPLPVHPTYRLHTRLLAHESVSGDTYHVEADDSGRLRIVLADAMGHGFSAGLLTTVLHGYLPRLPMIDPPDAVLTALNGILAKISGNSYMTALCLTLDPNGSVELASAGHPYPLCSTPVGIDFPPPGQALGLFEEVHAAPVTVKFKLPVGGKLLLYTDGITEWRESDEHDEFGRHRLADVFIGNAQRSPEALVERLVEAAREYAQSTRPRDDMSLLVIEHISSQVQQGHQPAEDSHGDRRA